MTAAQAARLYDHTFLPQNPLAMLAAPAFEAGTPFPPKERVSIGLLRGLYVSFSATGFTGGLMTAFERQ